MRIARFASLLLLTLAVVAPQAGNGAAAEGADGDMPEKNGDFSFVYAAVLGSGYYKFGDARVIAGRLPLSMRLAPINERNRIKLLLPVTVGVADIFDEEGEIEINTQLLTASVMPGVAWEHLARKNWMLVPSVGLGIARDFDADTNAWLYSLALRSYAWWNIDERSRLGLGNRLLGAGQLVSETGNQSGFVLFESGVEWDYKINRSYRGQALSVSAWALWQHFIDDANRDAFAGEHITLENYYRFGLTFGFHRPIKVFRWIPLHRVGMALGQGKTQDGELVRSLTLNLGFPLAYDY